MHWFSNWFRNKEKEVKKGYLFGVSRGLINKSDLAYEYQIWLIEKTVAPKLYIVCVTFGAVRHTCAIGKCTNSYCDEQ